MHCAIFCCITRDIVSSSAVSSDQMRLYIGQNNDSNETLYDLDVI